MNFPANTHAVLAAARASLPSFYTKGSARDAALMDMLVLVHSLLVKLNSHRPESRDETFEETYAAAQCAFLDLSREVRQCAAFGALSRAERATFNAFFSGERQG